MKNSFSVKFFSGLLVLSLAWMNIAGAQAQGTIAYEIAAGTAGNQAFDGALGMSFIVNEPGIVVTSLGVFDDASDGIGIDLHARLWSRDDGGTPDDIGDDSGIAIIASRDFSAMDPGTLVGGQRFMPIEPLLLEPGSYMIVGQGFGGGTDQNGNQGAVDIDGFSTNDGGGLVTFVANARFGAPDASVFPSSPDGPALDGGGDRYGAGTFTFEAVPEPTTVALAVLGILCLFGIGRARRKVN